jgi:hypothetical protein
MFVRLTRKLAEIMEGVDLSAYADGDVFELLDRDADLLIRGGWAEQVQEARVRSNPRWRAVIAADRSS